MYYKPNQFPLCVGLLFNARLFSSANVSRCSPVLRPDLHRYRVHGTEHRAIANPMTELMRRDLLDLQYRFALPKTRPSRPFEIFDHALIQLYTQCLHCIRQPGNFHKEMNGTIPGFPVLIRGLIKLEDSLNTRLPDRQFLCNPLFQGALESLEEPITLAQTIEPGTLQQWVQLASGILQRLFTKLVCRFPKILWHGDHVFHRLLGAGLVMNQNEPPYVS